MKSNDTSFLPWPYLFVALAWVFFSCDGNRLYEENRDFKKRSWTVTDEPTFEFVIPDSLQFYTVYYNVRNSLDYPYSRIFVSCQVYDSANLAISRKLVYNDLFDQKTGKPFGESGLGDLYDHQFPLLKHFRFKARGTYTIKLSQFMRQDTLPGILAVGVRVERESLIQDKSKE